MNPTNLFDLLSAQSPLRPGDVLRHKKDGSWWFVADAATLTLCSLEMPGADVSDERRTLPVHVIACDYDVEGWNSFDPDQYTEETERERQELRHENGWIDPEAVVDGS